MKPVWALRPTAMDLEKYVYPPYAQIVIGVQSNELYLSEDEAAELQSCLSRARARGQSQTLLEKIWEDAVAAYDELQTARGEDEVNRDEERLLSGICLGLFQALAHLMSRTVAQIRAKVIEIWENTEETDD